MASSELAAAPAKTAEARGPKANDAAAATPPSASPTTDAEPSTTAIAEGSAAPPPPAKDESVPPPKDDSGPPVPPKPAEEDCGCGNIGKDAPVTDTIPSVEDLEKIAEVQVQDAEGKAHSLKSIVEAAGTEKHMVIFIRHFFCGHCQEYTTALSSSIPPSSLPPNTRLTIIGCGSHELIPTYSQNTSNAYPLYAEPSQEIYKSLGMIRTKGMGDKKPEYIKSSLFSSVMRSVAQGLGSGSKALKGGDFWQVGGEFLFVKPSPAENAGKLWPVTWAHRMKNTRDHAEIKDLKRVLGIGDAAATANGMGVAGAEEKPRRSSTFFGRKNRNGETKTEEKTAEATA